MRQMKYIFYGKYLSSHCFVKKVLIRLMWSDLKHRVDKVSAPPLPVRLQSATARDGPLPNEITSPLALESRV